MIYRTFATGMLVLAAVVAVPAADAAIPPAERNVLIALYTDTNGAGWITATNWNDAAETECTWFGVTCDGTSSHVTAIDLENNNLTGTLPSLSGLAELNTFLVGTGYDCEAVNRNLIGGAIPALPAATSDFEAGCNQLNGSIPSLGALSFLTTFDVSGNLLTGTIPSLTGLIYLARFDVSNNQLSGAIPALDGLISLADFEAYSNLLGEAMPSLNALPSLTRFHVGGNRLTGTIPSLTSLNNLASFYAYGNQFTGSIPPLAGLTNLVYFSVDRNQLTGTIPALTGLGKLAGFTARRNQLSGTIPSLDGLSKLETFYVYNNQLSGAIPSLSGLTSLYDFDVSSNQLSGSIPDLGDQATISYFWVGSNRLTGQLPVAPGSLAADNGAYLCPNDFSVGSLVDDPAWDTASVTAPWWATPFASNHCDDTFNNAFEYGGAGRFRLRRVQAVRGRHHTSSGWMSRSRAGRSGPCRFDAAVLVMKIRVHRENAK